MRKNSINLLIIKGQESYTLKRLKVFLPITALISVLLFFFLFSFSLVYLNRNINRYNLLKNEVEKYQKLIINQQSKEGIYILTSRTVDVLTNIVSSNRNLDLLLTELSSLQFPGADLTSVTVDSKNTVMIKINTDSAEVLDQLVVSLLEKEEKNIFKSIKLNSASRDKKGRYELNITTKLNPEALL